MNLIVFKEKIFTKKNIILLIVILVLAAVAISLFFMTRKKEEVASNSIETYNSKDSSISLTLSSNYNFQPIASDEYELLLNSSDYLSNIYISKVTINNIKDLNKFMEADKNDYISKFPNISQVSDITETTVNTYTAYNYHFYYKDTMYVDVYWVMNDNTFYIIDFNLNTSSIDINNFSQEVLNTIAFN